MHSNGFPIINLNALWSSFLWTFVARLDLQNVCDYFPRGRYKWPLYSFIDKKLLLVFQREKGRPKKKIQMQELCHKISASFCRSIATIFSRWRGTSKLLRFLLLHLTKFIHTLQWWHIWTNHSSCLHHNSVRIQHLLKHGANIIAMMDRLLIVYIAHVQYTSLPYLSWLVNVTLVH